MTEHCVNIYPGMGPDEPVHPFSMPMQDRLGAITRLDPAQDEDAAARSSASPGGEGGPVLTRFERLGLLLCAAQVVVSTAICAAVIVLLLR